MKNKKLNTNFSKIPKTLGGILRRFHVTLFIIFITAALAYAVMLLNGILTEASTGTTDTTTGANGSINQATLDRINELRTSDTGSAVPALTGRSNPFAE